MKRYLARPKEDVNIRSVDSVLCVGHRGARAYSPENTLCSFSKAYEMGCHMIEIDVHMSSDLQIIVHHDDDLLRCTNISEVFPEKMYAPISDLTLAEIKKLDAGAWFLNQIWMPSEKRDIFLSGLTEDEMEAHIKNNEIEDIKNGVAQIPTLQEALGLAKKYNGLVNIEIKSLPKNYPNIAKKVVDAILESGMERSVVISSFDHKQLVFVRKLNKKIATAVLSSDKMVFVNDYLDLIDADSYNPGCYGDYDSIGFGSVSGKLDFEQVSQVVGAGKMCFIWTCNDVKKIKELFKYSLTGIVTDYPNRFYLAAQH